MMARAILCGCPAEAFQLGGPVQDGIEENGFLYLLNVLESEGSEEETSVSGLYLEAP